jgi:hypothetical protein
MQESIRSTSWVRFTREDGDDWPDFTDYAGRSYRPDTVLVMIDTWPGGQPGIHHADVYGNRVLKRGGLGAGWSRGWAGRFAEHPDLLEESQRPPAYVTALAQRALDSVTAREETRS